MSNLLYMESGMSFEERSTWLYAVTSVGAFGVYLAIVLGQARAVPLSEVPYAGAMLWTIGAAIAVSIVGRMVIAAIWPEDAGRKDQRDKEIGQVGERIGRSFVVIGAVTALVLALAEVDHFWIANSVYLAFFLSMLLESTAKIIAYRQGFQAW